MWLWCWMVILMGDETVLVKHRAETFQMPTMAAVTQARNLFTQTFRNPQAAELVAAWQELGMTYGPWNSAGWMLLTETPPRRGRGFYLFSPHQNATTVLQVPHPYFDRHTGEIGLALLREGHYRAGAWSNVQRHTQDGEESADPAHRESSFFQAFQQAWSDQGGQTLQLHGFAAEARNTAAAQQADMILSSGYRPPPWHLYDLRDHLATALAVSVLLYGVDTFELGATTNVQAQHARGLGTGFLHLECSLPMRKRLLNDPQARQTLIQALQAESLK